jgi:hypothetical protein
MSGVLNITRGRRQAAVRGTIYGDEGIGKSTLATQFPAPLVLDTEDGTHHLDVARVSVHDWKTLTLAVTELAVNAQGFQTIVIDSADWAEKLLIEWLLKTSGKKSIEDFGFGKGYTMVAEHWTRFLASCDVLVSHGINVVWVAHSCVKRVSPPDQTDGYDRYELKLTRQVSPLLREWCDLLLFCSYKMKLVEGGDGRLKAQGGKERVMHAEHSAAWSAKNRFGLPAEMPMEIGQLAGIFGATPAKPKAPGWLERVKAATTVADLDAIGNDADVAESTGELSPEKRKKLDTEIAKRHDVIEPKEVANVMV